MNADDKPLQDPGEGAGNTAKTENPTKQVGPTDSCEEPENFSREWQPRRSSGIMIEAIVNRYNPAGEASLICTAVVTY